MKYYSEMKAAMNAKNSNQHREEIRKEINIPRDLADRRVFTKTMIEKGRLFTLKRQVDEFNKKTFGSKRCGNKQFTTMNARFAF